MGGIAGTSVNASGLSSGNLLWAGTAISFLESNAAPRPYVHVGAPNCARRLRELRVGSGGTVDEFLFPVGTEEVPSVWGARGYVAPHLAAGTAYIYSPSSCHVVNRTSGFDIEIDRSRLSTSTARR
jgi:hypothetical protein